MRRLTNTTTLLGLLLASLVPLTGCGNLLPKLAGLPPALYELSPPSAAELAANPEINSLPVINAQVLVDIPQSSAGIDTPRIALLKSNNTIAYFQNVSWTDRAPVMFQSLIVDSLDNSRHLPAIGRENMGLRADYLIKSELGAIEADYTGGKDAPDAVIELDIKLVTMPRRVIVASGHFRSSTPAKSDTMEDIATAFQQAADDVLEQATVWSLNEISQKGKEKPHRKRE